MEMLIKFILSFMALACGSIIGGWLGWNIGKLFRPKENEEN